MESARSKTVNYAAKAKEHQEKAKDSAPIKRRERFEQLQLYQGNTVVPNLAGKSLLFRPVMKGRRPEAREWKSVPTINMPGITVSYKGKALDQVDLTGWLVTIQLAKERGGTIAAFTGQEFLKRLRKHDSSRDYEWLSGWYSRMTETFVRVSVTGESDGAKETCNYKGHLVASSLERVVRKSYVLDLDKALTGFFSVDGWSLYRLDHRLALGQNQWALSFQAFLVANKSPCWLCWDQIHQLWGAGYSDIATLKKDFKRRVLKPLCDIGFIKHISAKPATSSSSGAVGLSWV